MALRAGWKHLIRSCRLIESWISARLLLDVRTRLNLPAVDPYVKEARRQESRLALKGFIKRFARRKKERARKLKRDVENCQ